MVTKKINALEFHQLIIKHKTQRSVVKKLLPYDDYLDVLSDPLLYLALTPEHVRHGALINNKVWLRIALNVPRYEKVRKLDDALGDWAKILTTDDDENRFIYIMLLKETKQMIKDVGEAQWNAKYAHPKHMIKQTTQNVEDYS